MVNSKLNNMDRPLKMWEFILGILGVLITVAMLIYNRGTMDARNQVDIDTLKYQMSEMKSEYRQQNTIIMQKVDGLDNKTQDILVILQNKENRK